MHALHSMHYTIALLPQCTAASRLMEFWTCRPQHLSPFPMSSTSTSSMPCQRRRCTLKTTGCLSVIPLLLGFML